jgi:hypothetical protein
MTGTTADTNTLETEKVAVIDWFIKHSVPSISPQTSLHLLSIKERIDKEITEDSTTPQAIKAYSVALGMVARAGHIHQGIVIAQLERMVSWKE